jgi:hypothetical protein
LSATKVDGSGLAALAKLDKLDRLLLDATPVTDDTVRNLPPLASLRHLDVELTAVTEGGLQFLRTFPGRPGASFTVGKERRFVPLEPSNMLPMPSGENSP